MAKEEFYYKISRTLQNAALGLGRGYKALQSIGLICKKPIPIKVMLNTNSGVKWHDKEKRSQFIIASPGGGHGNPLQYSCLENPMDRGIWWITVCGVAKVQTWLSDFHFTFPFFSFFPFKELGLFNRQWQFLKVRSQTEYWSDSVSANMTIAQICD